MIDRAPELRIISIVTVFYIVFFAMMSGLRAIDGRLISTARIFGAKKRIIMLEIYWKSVQPFRRPIKEERCCGF
jgi:ABC-type nitrate/sulfonate/bicarbonate transport system permease component